MKHLGSEAKRTSSWQHHIASGPVERGIAVSGGAASPGIILRGSQAQIPLSMVTCLPWDALTHRPRARVAWSQGRQAASHRAGLGSVITGHQG